jgi:squalene synthase HpnC
MPIMHWDFAAQLERYGPQAGRPPVAPAEAWQYCRQLALTHYENFSVASALLPRHLLRHFHSVYAYCRWSDDLADEAGGGKRALDLLAWWRGELLAAYEGKARHPVFVALRETIGQFHIPPDPFLDLITAFEQDQRVHEYATFDDLVGYCKNSANPVGRLVLYLCQCHDDERGRLSDHICTALQLANFWQDVRRDLEIGRVYLPIEDRTRFGYADADLDARRFTPAFAMLMEFEVERTRDLFFKGYPLVDLVPAEVQADIELFIQGGLGILRKIEETGCNVLERRPVLTKWEKGVLVAGAMWRRLRGLVSVG